MILFCTVMMFTFSLDGSSCGIFSAAVLKIMSDRLAADGAPPPASEILQDKKRRTALYPFSIHICLSYTEVL